MGLIRDEDVAQIRQRLKDMVNPVRLIHFTQELNLEYGRETRQLLEELAAVSDNLSLEVYNFLLDKEKVAEYGIDKVPATVVRNGKDHGIRFYGIPAGYEFSALLDLILAVSRGESGLGEESREKLRRVTSPLHLEVFVTPTCPHCSQAVRLAQRFAMENEVIKADAIESAEFPDLAGMHRVFAVPKTVINGTASIEGSLPESFFLDRILAALGPSEGTEAT